jgi:hypothetical protein
VPHGRRRFDDPGRGLSRAFGGEERKVREAARREQDRRFRERLGSEAD